VRRSRVVINADDYGASQNINAAIAEAFAAGLISSATIMANTPGFLEACTLAKQSGFADRIGLHLNLTAGKPLTSGITRCPNFCKQDGEWRPPRRILWVNRREASALEMEITAQIRACIDQGINPTHIDSHHNMHAQPGLIPLVVRSARRHSIRAIRTAINCRSHRGRDSAVHRVLANALHLTENLYLRSHNLAKTEYCGDARDVQVALSAANAKLEIIVHPTLDRHGKLVDMDGEDLRTRLASLRIPTEALCNYRELCGAART
jgi:predicted glycoside hydrolase/deacetylase ChbG (UPF0249 family)